MRKVRPVVATLAGLALVGVLVVAAHAAQKIVAGHTCGGGGGGAGGGTKLVGSIPASAAGRSAGGAYRLTGGFIAAAQVWQTHVTEAVASRAASSGMVSSLTAMPTDGGGAQITFALPAAATVEVRVLNMAGRLVRTITPGQDCSAGLNTVVWTGLSDTGLRVPSGRYLIEVRARSGDGAQASGMTAVPIGR